MSGRRACNLGTEALKVWFLPEKKQTVSFRGLP